MKKALKKIIRLPYRFVVDTATRVSLMLKAKIVKRYLPEAYRDELSFFEDVRSQVYKDPEYLSKRIRMLTHWVDKTFTLSEKIDKDTTARQVETMVKDLDSNRPSDSITCQWVSRILEYHRNPSEALVENSIPLSPDVPRTLDSLIKSRRSVRSYKSQKIEKEVLDRILEAGLWAPSGCNRQPIEYLVVDDPDDVLVCQKYAGEYYNFPREAAVNIIILVDPRGYALPKQRHMAYLEAGAAIQNILLTAHSLGLGSCWMFWAKHDQDFNTKFKIQPWLLPVGLVCLGYPDRLPPIVPKRKNISDCVHDKRKD